MRNRGRGAGAKAFEPAFVGSTRVLSAGLDPRTGPTGRHIGRSAPGELALRGVFLAFEGGKRAARKVVWSSPDHVDRPV